MIAKQFKTLVEMLEYRGVHSHDSVAFTFNEERITYGTLWDKINLFGAILQGLGVGQGDRVLLALPNGAEFFTAFYGIQRMGAIAVPVFPGSGLERIFLFAELCGANLLIAPNNTPDKQLASIKAFAREQDKEVITVSDPVGAAPQTNFPKIQPDDIAFLQYTSGSTGNPKGVKISHDNLLTNIVQMINRLEVSAEDIFISWLPVYHDMGLILMTMAPFYLGAIVHLLPTSLRDIQPWLQAIQNHHGSFTAAPDFAYRLCVRNANPHEYDLSSLRMAMNAAEPVRARTNREFETANRLKNVMLPAYGLAEATVGVSISFPGSPIKVDERGFVSVGQPLQDIDVKIIKDGENLPNGEIGEIVVNSPANTSGYYNNPLETQRVFLPDGSIHSGDLGYLDEDGYLYIVSRVKNIIKRLGETISPREVEELVDRTQAVRYSAAVGIDRGGVEGEQVYIFAEIRRGESKSEDQLFDLTLEIVNAIHTHMGFRPGRVYLVKPHSIPLTYNGKIQYLRLRDKYLDGSLRAAGHILYPDY